MICDLRYTIYNILCTQLRAFKLSIVHCSSSIILLFSLLFSTSLYANDTQQETAEDFTKEVLLAIKYSRCQDALNMLIEKERAEDTLSVQHRYLKAEAYACMGSYKTALDIYNRLLKKDKDNPSYVYRRAMVYAKLPNWSKAYKDCMHLYQLMPGDANYCESCGVYAYNAEKYKDAIMFLQCHLQIYTQDIDAQYVMALACQELKDYGKALQLINVCIEAQPREPQYYLARAKMYEETDVLNFAAGDYAAYLKQNTSDHKTWLQYALLLQKLDRTKDACSAFAQAKANGNLDAGKYLRKYCR